LNLKFCDNNRGTVDAVKIVEREFPRLRVQLVPCLRKCGPCREMLVAVLDGETITAADPQSLVRQLRQLLSER